ncbi:MAG: hypothetical protein NWP78_00895 [Ilumatobacteraceae bacterium]|nr:hypothetical protein [Ilumatobacteraceae bacterium]
MNTQASAYPDESDGYWMHYHDQDSQQLADAIIKYAVDRMRLDPPPLDAPKSLSVLQRAESTGDFYRATCTLMHQC